MLKGGRRTFNGKDCCEPNRKLLFLFHKESITYFFDKIKCFLVDRKPTFSTVWGKVIVNNDKAFPQRLQIIQYLKC